MGDPPTGDPPIPARLSADGQEADDGRGWPPKAAGLSGPDALDLLATGDLELVGRLVVSSNNALVGTVTGRVSGGGPEPIAVACVYKPTRGERPLWDFPDGTLALREVAAHVLSDAGGWGLVPPTVLRDGPFGPGMLQLWVEPDEAIDRVALVVEGDARLRPMALFDAVANNADRKVGHVLPASDGRIYGVDHGICFHEEPKLRTVLWQWQGEPLDDGEVERLRALRGAIGGHLGERLARLLHPDEVTALDRRIADLLHEGRFPLPDPDRPAIPWPPY